MSPRSRAGVPGASCTSLPARPRVRPPAPLRGLRPLVAALVLLLVATACGTSTAAAPDGDRSSTRPLVIGAIPDQDTSHLQQVYGTTARYLSAQLGIPVEYRPVTDYASAVSQFRTGDLDLVWFGGLTGVQARLQTPGARVLVQRDVDARFHSVFIAGTATGLQPVTTAAGLSELASRTFTFGSRSSTSGYLVPAHHLLRAGVDPRTGFSGPPGFSGSHDRTIDLVESGTYDAGVLNEQVWKSRLAEGTVDPAAVRVLWTTPAFPDYQWVLGPTAVEDLGADLPARVTRAFTRLSPADPDQAHLLQLFGAGSFVPATAGEYAQIEQVGRELGLLGGG